MWKSRESLVHGEGVEGVIVLGARIKVSRRTAILERRSSSGATRDDLGSVEEHSCGTTPD